MGAFFVSNIESLYPHNKKVFLEAMENLKTHKKLGIVQATGTGKGKLASCFVEHVLKRKPNAKILILAPLNSVIENYKDNFGLTVDFVSFDTYYQLPFLDKKDLFNIGLTYDLIIVDEFHRLGGEKWGPAIKTVFDGVDNPQSTCRVIGFTATPIRYLDNARDMSDELFGGNVIQGLNLEDAICEGILPGFVYNACYFSTEDKLAEVEKKLNSNDYKIVDDTIRNDLTVKVRELRMLYHNKLKIETILRDTTKDLNENQKWIIFCRDKDSLKEICEICKSWFMSEPSLYIIHSDKNTVDNKRILKEFRESKSGVNVMLCIDMLNEGVHIKDIDGIIMLRKTDSPIIFLQQLGRALEAGKTTQPLIYDLVGNYKDLRIENGGLAKTQISIVKGIEEKVKKVGKSNYVIVRNFTEELDNVMSELSQFIAGRPWTEDDLSLLRKYYPIGGWKVCQENGLSRPKQSIVTKAYELGIKCNDFSELWSEDEVVLLKKYYPIGGSKLCKEKGLNRTTQSISSHAQIYGLKYSPWTKEEDDILRKYYPEGGCEACIEHGLNKSKSMIFYRARKLGIKRNSLVYSEEEDQIVIKYYPVGSVKLCQEMGLNRSVQSIKGRARQLGITSSVFWRDEEIEILKKYYPIGGTKLCIENGLNRKASTIRAMAIKYGLSQKRDVNKWNKWSDKEFNILYKYYPIGGAELCKQRGIDRTIEGIRKKARKLGIIYNKN